VTLCPPPRAVAAVRFPAPSPAGNRTATSSPAAKYRKEAPRERALERVGGLRTVTAIVTAIVITDVMGPRGVRRPEAGAARKRPPSRPRSRAAGARRSAGPRRDHAVQSCTGATGCSSGVGAAHSRRRRSQIAAADRAGEKRDAAARGGRGRRRRCGARGGRAAGARSGSRPVRRR
jgi:hypothetical protein